MAKDIENVALGDAGQTVPETETILDAQSPPPEITAAVAAALEQESAKALRDYRR